VATVLNITNGKGFRSCTHGTIKRVELDPDVPGKLYGAAGAYLKPRDLATVGAQVYVPLAGIAHGAAHGFPGTVLNWRMQDYGCWSAATLRRRARRLAQLVLDGWTVVVACHGGHGRTGTVLAAVAVELGIAGACSDPVAWIREWCPCAVEAEVQEDTLAALAWGQE
jgi:hypothetical protein